MQNKVTRQWWRGVMRQARSGNNKVRDPNLRLLPFRGTTGPEPLPRG